MADVVHPLAGITVVDFSRVLAVPLATQVLAELGADVIKIERPGRGDEARQFEPRLPEGESAYFMAFNRGKNSVTLDLKSAEGQQIARRLCASADVVVENFMPGVMAGFGLDYGTLSAENPGLVYVSATGFGQTGPYRDRKGYDTIFQAMSGIMWLTGQRDGPPAKPGVPIADMTSGLWVAMSVLSGLVGRAASGRGCHADVAMLDVQLSLLAVAAARLFALDEDPIRSGTEHPGRVPSAAFQCRDGGWIHISGSDQHWRPLCETLGLTELAEDPDLATNAGRLEGRAKVMAALKAAIADRDRDELAERLRAADVPVGEVRTVREALHDRHAFDREMLGSFDHPTVGEFPAIRTPITFEGEDNPRPLPPPRLGADTERVLRTYLGMADEEIAALRANGVI